MIKPVIFSIAIFISASSSAQPYFQKVYGGSENEEMHRMIRSNDGGFIMVGYTESYGLSVGYGATDAYVIKTDSNGSVQWSKSLGLETVDDAWWIEPTSDSDYVICGSVNDNYSYLGILVVKINEQGDILWQKVLQSTQKELGYCIRQTIDGGFVIAAETTTDTDIDFLLIKTDAEAQPQWTKEIGGSDSEIPNYVMQTPDGGFLITGISRFGFYWLHIYTVKTDGMGNLQWEKAYNTFPYFSKCNVSNAIATSDGGYLLAGSSTHNQPLSDIILLKIDGNGTEQWTKTYGGNDAEYCGSMLETKEGNLLVCGQSASSGSSGYYDALAMLIDQSGHLLKSSSYGVENADDIFVSAVEIDNGDFVLGGYTSGFSVAGKSDFMMMRVSSDLEGITCDSITPQIDTLNVVLEDTVSVFVSDVTVTATDVTFFEDSGVMDSVICELGTLVQQPEKQVEEFVIYPNPSANPVTVLIPEEMGNDKQVICEIENLDGQVLFSQLLSATNYNEIYLPENITSGVYIVRVKSEDMIRLSKLIYRK